MTIVSTTAGRNPSEEMEYQGFQQSIFKNRMGDGEGHRVQDWIMHNCHLAGVREQDRVMRLNFISP